MMLRAISCMLLTASLLCGAETAADAKPPAKPYPFTTCLVSGEALGDLTTPVTIVRDGQQLSFCCKGCQRRFDKDPEKYLKKLAEAEVKAKPVDVKPADKGSDKKTVTNIRK